MNDSSLISVSLLALVCILSAVAADSPAQSVKHAAARVLRVSGAVFEDIDGNGRRGEAEPGVAGVAVSDGVSIVETDENGEFLLDARFPAGKEECLVFITKPAGYKVAGSYFRRVPLEEIPDFVDFSLTRCPDEPQDDFAFIHCSDTHVSGDETGEQLAHDLKEMSETDVNPLFLANTGDLVNSGNKPDELDTYIRAVSSSPLPCYAVQGNHDLGDHYRQLIGPEQYSFEYGAYHFVSAGLSGRGPWVDKDIAWARAAGRHVVVLRHTPPTANELETLAAKNCISVHSGHYHATRIRRHDDLLDLNIAPPRMGGIDSSPRGFWVVSLSNGRARAEYRFGGLRRFIRIVAPEAGVAAASGEILIRITAYDSARTIKKVACALLIEGRETILEAAHCGGWTWRATWKCEEAADNIELAVRAEDSAGDSWTATREFSITDTPTAEPKLGEDWPMFKRDASRSSFVPSGPRPPLRLAWLHASGGYINYGSPVVYNGRVYIGVMRVDTEGFCGLLALDAATGAEMWRFETESDVWHAPCAGEGKVFALSHSGALYAVDAETGVLVWKIEPRDPKGAGRWEVGAPLYADGAVYGGSSPLMAVNAADGQLLWEQDIGADFCNDMYSAPLLAGGRLVAAGNGQVLAFDPRNGTPLWKIPGRATAADKELLYVTSPTEVSAHSPLDGAEQWRTAVSDRKYDRSFSSPALGAGRLLAGIEQGTFLCFDLATRLFQKSLPMGKALLDCSPYRRGAPALDSSPAIAGGYCYFGAGDGTLNCLDMAGEGEIWRFEAGGPLRSSPAVSGDMLFIAGMDGNVYAFAGAPPD